jgi:serine/threonine protein kinase
MEVADLPVDDRDAALAQACGGDAALRADVEALLRAEVAAGGFMGDPANSAAGVQDALETITGSRREQVGQMIGRYKLLEPVGEGGFGVGWAAEQREPVKRRVALKVIKLGMDTKQVIARFEAERQALALMDHPNIAKVLDAGATETGRPYFVMELVKGVPLLDYCDTEKLDTRARLDLFIKVCQAIQHAHQKGIIHRDIKPSNVLITLHDGVPVPKVIDFGVAKATNQELTEKTLYTQHRQMVGTPAYMSPEQAEMSGLDIDTRSDVYSLGVLLYELLTGTTPFDTEELLSKGFAEMMRFIREVEPHKPSTRVSTLGETATRTADQRRADVKKLGLILKGDLDWIVMKCLEKDRTRRYETANGLAADIRRYLDDEPVVATPPSALYRTSKFVRRNRTGVGAAALVALALLTGAIVAGIGFMQASQQRERVQDEADKAGAINRFLRDMLMGKAAAAAFAGAARAGLRGGRRTHGLRPVRPGEAIWEPIP